MSSRLTNFDCMRNLQKCQRTVDDPEVKMKVEDRRQKLEMWKKQKEKKKREEAARKKKPFVSGVVPAPLKYVPPPPPRSKMFPTTSGLVTRSRKRKSNSVAIKLNVEPDLPDLNLTYNIAPKSAKCKKTEQISKIAEEVKKISPCVTMSKGKDNGRRDMKQKLDEGLFVEDSSNMESVDYFRKQLASEIERMRSMCKTWDRILEQNTVPENVQECVLAATGQARLLMSSKLAQYAALVERCGRPDPAALVTLADLRGFRDMVFIQVEDIDLRFNKLEKLRERGWQEEQPVIGKPKIVKQLKPGGTTVKPSGGPSKLKEIIAAARRAKKEQSNPPPAPTEIKTFDAGFFSLESPVRCPLSTHNIPQRETSFQMTVLPSEAKKSAYQVTPKPEKVNSPWSQHLETEKRYRKEIYQKIAYERKRNDPVSIDVQKELKKENSRMKSKLLRQKAVAE